MKRFVFIAFFPTTAEALPPCVDPSVPYCITSWTTYEDEFSFNSCRRDIDYYLSSVESYLQCLDTWVNDTVNEAQAAQAEVVSQYEEAIAYFNCKAADPDRYC